jgi:hypothetical protein
MDLKQFAALVKFLQTNSSVVGSGAVLQIGRSWVLVPTRSLNVSINLISPAAQ